MPPLPHRPAPHAPRATALLLTGGGARAAYQVGVLQALSELRQRSGQGGSGNPFPILTGTSAGAINAAALACGADDFDAAVARIALVWQNFQAAQVYRADTISLLRSGARWLRLLALGWLLARWRQTPPRSLLDNQPLHDLLCQMLPLQRLPRLIRQGHVRALAVTASSYNSGEHVTFFQSRPQQQPWSRSQRMAARDRIGHAHLLASSAIPFVFPATKLALNGHDEYFGDGSMRQSAPLAAAVHLGAERILVVGAGRMHEPRAATATATATAVASSYPSLAQIAGHALSNIFLDALAVDIERLERINQTLALIPPEARQGSPLRHIELLVVAPSERLDAIAARHLDSLPRAMRSLLGGLGVSSQMADPNGAALASYLLFESAYTQELMALGHADAMRQSAQLRQFMGW